MKQRWITAIALLAILIPSLYAGGIFFKVIATIFVIGGCYEILRLLLINGQNGRLSAFI